MSFSQDENFRWCTQCNLLESGHRSKEVSNVLRFLLLSVYRVRVVTEVNLTVLGNSSKVVIYPESMSFSKTSSILNHLNVEARV